MTRLLCFSFLFVLILPGFAQEEQAQPLPMLREQGLRDPRLFSQERERITFELQQIQRLIGVVRPDDVQTMEALTAQQAELAKQLRDLTQQMQSGPMPGMPTIADGQPVQVPNAPGMRPGMNVPGMGSGLPQDPRMPMQSMPMMPGNIPQNGFQNPVPYSPPVMPNPMPNQMPMYYPGVPPNWADQGQWGARLPQELTEVKQAVESLRKEVADLKDTIKALEMQIQLLTRNILLSERVKENGN